jgi:hypothetical protein
MPGLREKESNFPGNFPNRKIHSSGSIESIVSTLNFRVSPGGFPSRGTRQCDSGPSGCVRDWDSEFLVELPS